MIHSAIRVERERSVADLCTWSGTEVLVPDYVLCTALGIIGGPEVEEGVVLAGCFGEGPTSAHVQRLHFRQHITHGESIGGGTVGRTRCAHQQGQAAGTCAEKNSFQRHKRVFGFNIPTPGFGIVGLARAVPRGQPRLGIGSRLSGL